MTDNKRPQEHKENGMIEFSGNGAGHNMGSVVTQSGEQDTQYKCSSGEGGEYWKLRYEKLLDDYNHLQTINQSLENKLLTVVESFEKKKVELEANIEYEKSTLMADVNKLSTKLVDARIRLHDYEEKELIHASECNSPCHKSCPKVQHTNQVNTTKDNSTMNYDPNIV